LFFELVLQNNFFLLRWFYRNNVVICAGCAETMLFVALLLQKHTVYFAGFTETMLFIALVLQEQYSFITERSFSLFFHTNR